MGRRTGVAIGLWLAAAAAQAQVPEPDMRADVEAGRAAFADGDFPQAATRLGAAGRRLEDLGREEQYAFACELGAALIRQGETDEGRRRLVDGIAVARGPRLAECHAMAGDALLAVGAAEPAAHRLRASLEAEASDSVRTRYETIDAATRARVERLRRRLATRPVGVAVGPADTPEALAEAIARAVEVARPSRLADCATTDAWGRHGRVVCSYVDGPVRPYMGGNSYPLETFVYVRRGGRVHVTAAYPSGTGYDCEAGHLVEEVGRERLTSRQHGVDGWLFRVRERWDAVNIGDELGSRERRLVYACSRASGVCARVEEARQECVDTPARLGVCRGYDGEASVRRGLLTIRIDRGELPSALQEPIDLRTLAPPQPAASDPRRSRSRSMRGCRVVVRDPQPPLNVRARPSARAAVVGSLRDGTPVRVVGRAGAWARIASPREGYVWRGNLERQCGE